MSLVFELRQFECSILAKPSRVAIFQTKYCDGIQYLAQFFSRLIYGKCAQNIIAVGNLVRKYLIYDKNQNSISVITMLAWLLNKLV